MHRLDDLECTMNLVPEGFSGLRLKSNEQLSWASADSLGLRRDCRRIFRVVVAQSSS